MKLRTTIYLLIISLALSCKPIIDLSLSDKEEMKKFEQRKKSNFIDSTEYGILVNPFTSVAELIDSEQFTYIRTRNCRNPQARVEYYYLPSSPDEIVRIEYEWKNKTDEIGHFNRLKSKKALLRTYDGFRKRLIEKLGKPTEIRDLEYLRGDAQQVWWTTETEVIKLYYGYSEKDQYSRFSGVIRLAITRIKKTTSHNNT